MFIHPGVVLSSNSIQHKYIETVQSWFSRIFPQKTLLNPPLGPQWTWQGLRFTQILMRILILFETRQSAFIGDEISIGNSLSPTTVSVSNEICRFSEGRVVSFYAQSDDDNIQDSSYRPLFLSHWRRLNTDGHASTKHRFWTLVLSIVSSSEVLRITMHGLRCTGTHSIHV